MDVRVEEDNDARLQQQGRNDRWIPASSTELWIVVCMRPGEWLSW